MQQAAQTMQRIAKCIPAWIAFVASLVVCGWIGQHTTEGLVLASMLGVAIFLFTGLVLVMRDEVIRLRRDVLIRRNNEDLIRTTLLGTGEIVWTSDKPNLRAFKNNRWREITGQPAAIGQSVEWTMHVHPDDLQKALTAAKLALASRESSSVEYRLKTRGGRYVWVLDRIAPQFDDQGQFFGFIGLTVDIDEKHRNIADQTHELVELRRERDMRCSKIDNLAGRLESAQNQVEELADDCARKTEFIEALAENLRDPVQNITHAAEMICNVETHHDTQTQHLQRIADSAERLNEVLERTLELSSADHATQSTTGSSVEFDLRDMITTVVQRVRRTAEDRGVTITCDIHGDVPMYVKADLVCLRRALTLLWRSAIRKATKGPITMQVVRDTKNPETADLRFTITVPKGSIPTEYLERAFYPIDSGIDDAVGLGLGACQRVISQVNGSVALDNHGAHGPAFRLLLTVVDVYPNTDGRRADARLFQEAVRSNLGLVLDLSLGGMRIETAKPEEGRHDIELTDDTETIRLSGHVVWTRRSGFRKYEIGIKFADLSPDAGKALRRFASRNRMRRTMEAA